eukprot:TRINITY_DN105392_c0_g1_i1.p1 TRINITY_DN105392_c0_g1~~TRINITY_DN105392_c0_g1_i1.p1  ORF type:complete len:406 (+),score=93.64 TRINITY_DN105392_c0_g1_i1:43-1218(+)
MRLRRLVLGVVFLALLQPSETVLQELKTEADVLDKLRADKESTSCDAEEMAVLMKRGWWQAARSLVTSSQGKSDFASLEKVVRREVTQLKLRADELLLALSPQDDSSIGVVRCAAQWAQNSSAIFLSIKFSHRWSSPGALKVHDEKVDVSPCCFNFSALGDHSQLRKRYALDWQFYDEVDPEHWSWQLAAAGRMTAEFRKKQMGNWPRLLMTKSKPGNLGKWDAMQDKWRRDLEEFDRLNKKGEDDESEEAREEQLHSEGERKCVDSRTTPFKYRGPVTRLCNEYWPPRMETKKKGKSSTWLVLFHSPSEMGCQDMSAQCQSVKKRWEAVANKVHQVSQANVGAVDCDQRVKFCKKEKVGNMPFVRRYRKGKTKTFYGEWDIDSVMKIVTD